MIVASFGRIRTISGHDHGSEGLGGAGDGLGGGGGARGGSGGGEGGVLGRKAAKGAGLGLIRTMRPPSAAAIVRARARPRPVPSGRPLTLRSKMRGTRWGGVPLPS